MTPSRSTLSEPGSTATAPEAVDARARVEGAPASAGAPSETTHGAGRFALGGARALTLRELLRELPGDATVPIRWVLERLDREAEAEQAAAARLSAEERASETTGDRDLSADEYGRRRSPARSAEWVRDACRDGLIPGARKDGSEWVIPSDALGRELRAARSTRIGRGAVSSSPVGSPAPRAQASSARKRPVPATHRRWREPEEAPGLKQPKVS